MRNDLTILRFYGAEDAFPDVSPSAAASVCSALEDAYLRVWSRLTGESLPTIRFYFARSPREGCLELCFTTIIDSVSPNAIPDFSELISEYATAAAALWIILFGSHGIYDLWRRGPPTDGSVSTREEIARKTLKIGMLRTDLDHLREFLARLDYERIEIEVVDSSPVVLVEKHSDSLLAKGGFGPPERIKVRPLSEPILVRLRGRPFLLVLTELDGSANVTPALWPPYLDLEHGNNILADVQLFNADEVEFGARPKPEWWQNPQHACVAHPVPGAGWTRYSQ